MSYSSFLKSPDIHTVATHANVKGAWRVCRVKTAHKPREARENDVQEVSLETVTQDGLRNIDLHTRFFSLTTHLGMRRIRLEKAGPPLSDGSTGKAVSLFVLVSWRPSS